MNKLNKKLGISNSFKVSIPLQSAGPTLPSKIKASLGRLPFTSSDLFNPKLSFTVDQFKAVTKTIPGPAGSGLFFHIKIRPDQDPDSESGTSLLKSEVEQSFKRSTPLYIYCEAKLVLPTPKMVYFTKLRITGI